MYKRGLDAGGSEVRCAKSASDIYTAPSPCMEIKADDPVTVSYTHLDVYKRQG